MYVYARWSGWGLLVVPVWFLSVCGGPTLAVMLLHDLAVQGDDGIDHSGVPLGGLAAGLLAGGLVVWLLGAALNRRRRPDGGWIWINRHQFADIPVQNMGRHTATAGALLLPLGGVDFVPGAVVCLLVVAWAIVVITVLALLSRRRKARATALASTQ